MNLFSMFSRLAAPKFIDIEEARARTESLATILGALGADQSEIPGQLRELFQKTMAKTNDPASIDQQIISAMFSGKTASRPYFLPDGTGSFYADALGWIAAVRNACGGRLGEFAKFREDFDALMRIFIDNKRALSTELLPANKATTVRGIFLDELAAQPTIPRKRSGRTKLETDDGTLQLFLPPLAAGGDACVGKMLVDEGELVSAEQPLMEIETDTLTIQIRAPGPGYVSIQVAEGEYADPRKPLAVISAIRPSQKARTDAVVKAAGKSRAAKAAPTAEEQLNKLVGIASVKEEIAGLFNLAKVAAARTRAGLPSLSMSHHLVFSGNPGTGKTSVARILGQVYSEVGLLSSGHIIEADRSSLVGQYVGETAQKTLSVIEKAKGGVLFIDEAYSLVSSSKDDYGGECIATLLKAMEDFRSDLVVVAAGYKNEMQEFVSFNPGLKSRFTKTIDFPDFTTTELISIFRNLVRDANLKLDKKADLAATEVINEISATRASDFGNGRTIRNFFEKVLVAQANRLASSNRYKPEDLENLVEYDIVFGT